MSVRPASLTSLPRPAALVLTLLVSACGGGGGGGGGAPLPEPAFVVPAAPLVKVSAATPFAPGCAGVAQPGTNYLDAEVEPFLAIDPTDPARLLATWQQDRWSDGGALGLVTARSTDGGLTWTRTPLAASTCGGGTPAAGSAYQRASDPWVSFAPDGTAHAMSLSLDATSPRNAMLAFRSTDGGLSWGAPAVLIASGAEGFNDKNALTADPTDSNFVYAVWDQLTADDRGPTLLARSVDGGVTWEPARVIYDPGVGNQTLGNVVAVTSDGTVVNFFTEFRSVGPVSVADLRVVRSTDKGATWSGSIRIADNLAVGTADPQLGTPVRAGAAIGAIAAGPGNSLYVVWQDGRATGGQRDSILLSRSLDAGLTWSEPVVVNPDTDVPAFTPSVAVRADGVVGVSYFDMRSDTESGVTLGVQYWLAVSADGTSFAESEVSIGPFDLNLAPFARGLFLGDYMGLVARGSSFVPLFVQTNNQGTGNRQDVYLRVVTPPAVSALQQFAKLTALPAPAVVPDEAFRQRVSDHLQAVLASRPAWRLREAAMGR